MKGFLLIVALVLAVQGHPNCAPSRSDKTASHGIKNAEQMPSFTPDTGRVIVINQPAPNSDENRAKSKPDTYLKRLFSPENLPQTILSGIGIIGVIVAICTLGAIESQAREMRLQRVWMGKQWSAMKGQLAQMEVAGNQTERLIEQSTKNANAAGRSAEVADKSVNAFIASERPWLFLVPDARHVRSTTSIEFIPWAIENRGRTIAQLIQATVRCMVLRGKNKILDNPPNYGNITVNFHNTPIPPDGYIRGATYIEGYSGMVDGINENEIRDIFTNSSDLVVVGKIVYLDQIGNKKESRFCFYYATEFMDFRINLRAESEYHQCT